MGLISLRTVLCTVGLSISECVDGTVLHFQSGMFLTALGICWRTQDQELGRSACRDTDEETRNQTKTFWGTWGYYGQRTWSGQLLSTVEWLTLPDYQLLLIVCRFVMCTQSLAEDSPEQSSSNSKVAEEFDCESWCLRIKSDKLLLLSRLLWSWCSA